MKVWIYSGVPGSGKSTLIGKRHGDPQNNAVVSADSWFTRPDGAYDFLPAELPNAHANCLRMFVEALMEQRSTIVVDNTNTTVAEIAPYAALALAYGYELEIVTVYCNAGVAHARNVHGVPLEVIEAMEQRIAARELPPWWPQTFLYPDSSATEAA